MKLHTQLAMGWLRIAGSLKLQVSFAKEPYKRDDIPQKRPIILRGLLIVATPYTQIHRDVLPRQCVAVRCSVCLLLVATPWLGSRNSVLHCLTVRYVAMFCHGSVLQRVAICCSVLQYVAACCNMLQRVAICCSMCLLLVATPWLGSRGSVLQCVAVCCSVLQYSLSTSLYTHSEFSSEFTFEDFWPHESWLFSMTPCCHLMIKI